MIVDIPFCNRISIFETKQEIFFHIGKFYRSKFSKKWLEEILSVALSTTIKFNSVSKDRHSMSFKVNSLQGIGIDKENIRKKVLDLFLDSIYNKLENLITRRSVYFIDRRKANSLMGTHYFGIIDRGTNLIQVRPVTGCPLNCIYCSVDEGITSKTRLIDYMVKEKFLVEEVKKLTDYKGDFDIEAHIDGEGEPLIYPFIFDLIKDLKDCEHVAVVSLQSNGILLTYKFVDELIKSGLDRINVSINSIDKKVGLLMAGTKGYDSNQILEMIKYANEQGLNVLIAPVWIHGLNDKEIERLIEFVKKYDIRSQKHWPTLGIQNYEVYKYGRKVKGYKFRPFNYFYKELSILEKKYDIYPLILSRQHFNIHKSKAPQKVFNKKEVLTAKVVLPGRKEGEVIAFARGRLIEVSKVYRQKTHIKVRITAVKDTINRGIAM